MRAFLITISGILLSFVAFIAGSFWLTVIAMVMALVGAYAQYRSSLPFDFLFSEHTWKQHDEHEFKLVIPQSLHKKVSPTATVFKGMAPRYEEVGVSISTGESGAVVVGAAQRFSGKVTIN